MTWTQNLVPALAAVNWQCMADADHTFFDSNGILYTGSAGNQLISGSTTMQITIARLRITAKYLISNTEDMLWPHDNPCKPKMYFTLNLYPTIITDATDPNFGQQEYFQHINVPFAQSYYNVKNDATGQQYAYVNTYVPVDACMYSVDHIDYNLFMQRASRILSISVQGEYDEQALTADDLRIID